MVDIANNRAVKLNATQLQKLLYITYGYYLTKGIQITEETPKAWPSGPVFPRVHSQRIHEQPDAPTAPIEYEGLRDTVSKIVARYGTIHPSKLAEWAREPDSPWDEVSPNWERPLDNQSILAYFRSVEVV